MSEEQDQVGHVCARGTGYDQIAERAEERMRVVVVEEHLGVQSEGARPCHRRSVDDRPGGLRVAVRAIRPAGEEDRGPALQESGGRQRDFLVAPSLAAAADRDGRLPSGDDRHRSRGLIPSKSLRNHDRSNVTSLSFHRGRENVRGIAPSLRFLPVDGASGMVIEKRLTVERARPCRLRVGEQVQPCATASGLPGVSFNSSMSI